MSNCTNLPLLLVGLFACLSESQRRTSCVLFHWLTPAASLHAVLMLSRTLLLTLPRLLQAGLMTLHLMELGKSSLWSLIVKNALAWLWHSILSAISKEWACLHWFTFFCWKLFREMLAKIAYTFPIFIFMHISHVESIRLSILSNLQSFAYITKKL